MDDIGFVGIFGPLDDEDGLEGPGGQVSQDRAQSSASPVGGDAPPQDIGVAGAIRAVVMERIRMGDRVENCIHFLYAIAADLERTIALDPHYYDEVTARFGPGGRRVKRS